jgi:glycosyltransferase involved in cell wall biosynthesis
MPSLLKRLRKGICRILNLLIKINRESIKGVIIFSGSGFSFYERIIISLLCRLYNINHIFLIRDGNFILAVNKSRVFSFIAEYLLKIPYCIGVQGKKWVEFCSLLKVPENKIKIIRNWLPREYAIADKSKCITQNIILRFIFVGWLIKEKGILDLLDVVKQLLKEYEFEFVIVGGGTLENYINDEINNSAMKNKVYATGWLSSENVQRELEQAHVLVLPSETEGFPNVILEAMTKGLPIIATNVGGIPDSVHNDENGYLIEPNQPKQLMDAMKSYILDPPLVAKHSLKSLEIVKLNHNAENNCSVIFNIFTEN